MIVNALLNLFLELFIGGVKAIEAVNLPLNTINALTHILAFGNWIVGADIMALFTASVIFWWVFHLSIGLIVWVWEKLPFT